jgi:hypothetical protein
MLWVSERHIVAHFGARPDHIAIEKNMSWGRRLSVLPVPLFCSGLGPSLRNTYRAHWSDFSTGCSAATLISPYATPSNRLELLLRQGLIKPKRRPVSAGKGQ